MANIIATALASPDLYEGLMITNWLGGTAVRADIGAFDVELVDSTPPGSLNADPDIARWTPVHLEFYAPPGFTVVVVAQIGTDSALWMVCYDDVLGATTGGLPPLFADKTVVVTSGTADGGRSFVMDILPNGGWMRDNVTLVPYLALEVGA